MAQPSTTFKDNVAFFHALDKVRTLNGQYVFESEQKSLHNITSQDIWTEYVEYMENSAQADTYVANNPTIVKKYGTSSAPQPLTCKNKSNNKVFYINDSGTWIKNWIMPTDIPHPELNIPSDGYIIRLYNLDSMLEIGHSSGAWVIDGYAGTIIFDTTPPTLNLGIVVYVYVGTKGAMGDQINIGIGDAIAFLNYRSEYPMFPIEGEKYIVKNPTGATRKYGNVIINTFHTNTIYTVTFDGNDYVCDLSDGANDGITTTEGVSEYIVDLINANNSSLAGAKAEGTIIYLSSKVTGTDFGAVSTSVTGGDGTISDYNELSLGTWAGLNNFVCVWVRGFWKSFPPNEFKIYFNNEDQFWYRFIGNSTSGYYERIQSKSVYYVDFDNGNDDENGTVLASPAKTINKVLNSITTSKTASDDGFVTIYLLSDYDFNTNPVSLESTFWFDVRIVGTVSNTNTVTITKNSEGILTTSNWGTVPTSDDQYLNRFYTTDATVGSPILEHDSTMSTFTGEVLTVGAPTVYSGTLTNGPVGRGMCTLNWNDDSDTPQTCTDDGSGSFTHANISAGSINYDTGVVSITFATEPTITTVTPNCDYTQDILSMLGFLESGDYTINELDYQVNLSTNYIFNSSASVNSFRGVLLLDTINVNNTNLNIASNYRNDFIWLNNVIFTCTSIGNIFNIDNASNIVFNTANYTGSINMSGFAENIYSINSTDDNGTIFHLENCEMYNLGIKFADTCVESSGTNSITNIITKQVNNIVNLNRNSELYIKGDYVMDKGTHTNHLDKLGFCESNTKLIGSEINNLNFTDGDSSATFTTSKGLFFNGAEYHVLESNYDIRAYMPILNGFAPIDTEIYSMNLYGVVALGSNAAIPIVVPEDGKNIYKIFGRINIDNRYDPADNDFIVQIKVGTTVYGTLVFTQGNDTAEIQCDTMVVNEPIMSGELIGWSVTSTESDLVEDVSIEIEVK